MRLNESKLSVLAVFFDDPAQEFYLSQIQKTVHLSLDTVHRSLLFWTGMKVLQYRRIGRMKLYKLRNGELTDVMKNLLEVENG